MHIDNVIFLILSKNAYTKFSEGPNKQNSIQYKNAHPHNDCFYLSLRDRPFVMSVCKNPLPLPGLPPPNRGKKSPQNKKSASCTPLGVRKPFITSILGKLWINRLRLDSGSFSPSMQNEKPEIHKVFPGFPFFCLTKNLSLPALADLIRASLEIA